MLCICITMQQLPYPFYVLDINGFHQTNPFPFSEGLSKHPQEPIYRQPLKQHHKDFPYRLVRINAHQHHNGVVSFPFPTARNDLPYHSSTNKGRYHHSDRRIYHQTSRLSIYFSSIIIFQKVYHILQFYSLCSFRYDIHRSINTYRKKNAHLFSCSLIRLHVSRFQSWGTSPFPCRYVG